MLFNRSLKRKIQSSMFKTACLTLVVSMVCLLPLIYTSVIPLIQYASKSINNSITHNYITNFETEMDRMRSWQDTFDLADLNVNEMVLQLNQSIDEAKETQTNANMPIEDMLMKEDPQLYIDQLDTINQKRIILSTFSVLHEINKFIPLRSYIDMDVILTEFKVGDSVVFPIPTHGDDSLSNTISHFESMDQTADVKSYSDRKLLHIYNATKSTLFIYNDTDQQLGTVTTAVNPAFVFIVMFPIILIFIISGFLALLIAMLMSKLLSIPILKPITLLNEQLSAIAQEDYAFKHDMYVALRRPPTEIKKLRDNTNRIMKKMQTYYEDLDHYKDELEAQNEELQDYKDELEAQNAELEAQNIELADSKQVIEHQQDQLVHSEKMASIGQLSAAIAHEINTPLGAIKSNCQMAETLLPMIESVLEDSDAPKVNKAIKNLKSSNHISLEASKRMAEIIRNLKNFSRLDQSDFQDADINEGIQSVLVLTSNLWKNKVDIDADYGLLPLVQCYPGMLNQVFMNIIVNAIQASEQNSIVHIRTRHENDSIVVEIEDHGTGMTEEVQRQIFNSGFTTKTKDQGTGLGLSITKDIIDRHKGTIEVHSLRDHGSQFTIYLPIHQQTQ